MAGSGLNTPAISAAKIASQGKPARLEMLTTAATSAFDRVASVNLPFSRVRPGTTSGHGVKRCQASVSSSRSASGNPRDAAVIQHGVQRVAIHRVHRYPTRTASLRGPQRGEVACAPTPHHVCPIDARVATGADPLRLAAHGRVKIRRRALHIEQQRRHHVSIMPSIKICGVAYLVPATHCEGSRGR